MEHIDIFKRYNKFLSRVNYAESSILSHRESVKRFSKWLVVPVEEVTPTVLYQYLGYLHNKRLKPTTINSNLHRIKRFYDYLYHEENIKIPNPVKPSYKQKMPKPLPKFLSNREVSILFKSIKNKRDYAMFMLMLRCGLRVEEVVNLSLPSIDFESSTILVLRGKFRKDRVVYMGEEARHALFDYLNIRKRYRTRKVFLVQKGQFTGGPISLRGVQKRIEYYAKMTGITVSCHRLRHTMATQLLNAGAMLATVQEILGHDCIYSTQRYAKVSNTKVRRDFFSAMKKIKAM